MNTGKRSTCRILCALALLMALALSGCLSAQAEEAEWAGMRRDVTVILAQDAVRTYDLRNAEGKPLEPRMAPEMSGRGTPDVKGVEPDYRGVVGFMALQSEWEVSRFSTFNRTPWMLPAYDEDGETVVGEIQHKTPVLVIDQRLKEGKAYKFAGRLLVVRLDTKKQVWVDVTQFVTVPYWTLELKEAVRNGFCIAVYRSKSRYEPMDRKKHRGPLPDGTWVLMCDKAKFPRLNSPDRENNPLLGIIFRSNTGTESYYRFFLFFNEEDLTLVY